MTRDWTPTDAADAADDARSRQWERMPTDHATDQTFCPGCWEPCDDPDVEAFEELDELLCRECAAERLAQPDLFGD